MKQGGVAETMKRYLIILLIFWGISLTGWSQRGSNRTGFDLDEVVVTGKRSVKDAALVKTQIDSTQLAEATNHSLAELLTRHTPVFIKTYGLGSLATASFRGTAASHTQVDWNGMNINNPMLGQVDFSLIPVFFVDRAELYHGGSSLQEGSGALGGSVSIGSLPRWGTPFYGSVMQGIGSFGTYQTSVALGGGNRKVQASVRYQYEEAENDFKFLNTAVIPEEETRQKNAAYHKNAVVADIYWNPGKQNIVSLHGWWHQTARQLPHIMSYEGKGRDETQDDNELRLVAKWNTYWKKGKSELLSGFTYTGLDYFLANMTDLGRVINYDSRSTIRSYYNKHRAEWNVTPRFTLRSLLNADYHRVEITDRKTHEGYSASRTQLGATASAHYAFLSNLSAYALLRADYTDRKFAPLMPSVGVEYRPVKELVAKLNATRNYHQPTLNDLHWIPGGNPDLRPERGYTTDLSLSYGRQWGGFTSRVDVTGYLSDIDDWIIWRPSEYQYWTAENLKKVYARGFEANLYTGYAIRSLQLSLRANYGYTRTTNEDSALADDNSTGKQLIYIPEHKGNVMFETNWRGFYLYYTWSYTGERFTTSSNEATRHTLPGYGLHNVTLGKQFSYWKTRWDVQFKVNNLFDKDYQAILWRAMPQRNYTVLLKCLF